MPSEYLTDGDLAFIGLNSRDNPSSLPKGYVAKAINIRMDRGVTTVRKGLRKYTDAQLWSETKKVMGVGRYTDSDGNDKVLVVYHDFDAGVTNVFQFNPADGTFTVPTQLVGETITSPDGVDIVQAMDKVFITRGPDKRPIMWDMLNTFTTLPTSGTGHEFPNARGLMYFKNRLVAIGRLPAMDPIRQRDTVAVSHFAQWDKWAQLDAFTINQGGNDEVVSVVPWTLNEFLILCKNSTFYLNTGVERYATGDALSSSARLESLSVDIGCVAKESAVQIGDGVAFLSGTGVYFLKTLQGTSPDGVKLLTLNEPLSAPIDDVIQRINKEHAYKAVGAYWNSRYYLAVPLDESQNNNAVLVYNFMNKAWESVDVYPSNIDVLRLIVGKNFGKYRMFLLDSNEGVFMTEEAPGDEVGPPSGTPVLSYTETIGPYAGLTGAYVPFYLTYGTYGSTPIHAEVVTRRITIPQASKVRFSSVESDMVGASGASIEADAIAYNPDVTYRLDSFQTQADEDFARKNPVRKIAQGIQIRYLISNGQVTIRSSLAKMQPLGKVNQNIK